MQTDTIQCSLSAFSQPFWSSQYFFQPFWRRECMQAKQVVCVCVCVCACLTAPVASGGLRPSTVATRLFVAGSGRPGAMPRAKKETRARAQQPQGRKMCSRQPIIVCPYTSGIGSPSLPGAPSPAPWPALHAALLAQGTACRHKLPTKLPPWLFAPASTTLP